ncbi:ComC/BlpC family leader-containing pheromone/bacteriocin [Streptococcus mutans]|nr:ComC/BlpC family leader-containing pheromone/bacteriocin [Streptococcus mutans]
MMNTRTLEQFDVMDARALAAVEGGWTWKEATAEATAICVAANPTLWPIASTASVFGLGAYNGYNDAAH